MINNIIDMIADVISILIIGGILVWVFLFFTKYSCRKKGDKKALKQIETIEAKLKNIGKRIWRIFLMFLTIAFCSLLAIALKPIIYKLNFPLGEGYAIFTSYMIAICLWIIFRPKTTIGGAE